MANLETRTYSHPAIPGRTLSITVDWDQIGTALVRRLLKDRASYKGTRSRPQKVKALDGSIVAKWEG